MFVLAILIGIYSYIIFLFGISGLLYRDLVAFITLIFIISILIWLARFKLKRVGFRSLLKDKLVVIIAICLLLQATVNIIGAFGPELAFDALWYHLTLPKLYLLNHAIYHIPGGLLYYSDMPKLGEMLYVGTLALGNEITAKLLHAFFGILTSIAIYKFTRNYYSQRIAFIAVLIFYSNLVVAWESITAYVDLIRSFYEVLALWAFVIWYKTNKRKWLLLSAVMIGFAIMTKLLAIGSLLIFSILIVWQRRKIVYEVFSLWFIALLIPFLWFVFSFLHTGNPVYPFFSDIYQIKPEPISLFSTAKEIWTVFTQASDPISPLYLVFLPLLFVTYKSLPTSLKPVVWYSFLSIIVWYFTPRTGGGRFLLPYLPAMSIICAGVFTEVTKKSKFTKPNLAVFLIGVIILTAVISIGYRFMANKKYIPVIIGKQTKQEFLSNNLNFSYGDFYDVDNQIKNRIQASDKVLLYGFHNLYYVDFPFIDSSWVERGDMFTYIATQNTKIPARFENWQLIYSNDKTLVKLYKNKSSKTNTY